MNLKDAFRAQNKLQALMDEASCILQDRDNTLKVTTPSEYAEHINQVVAFLMAMLAEREKLSAAICAAKSRLPLDMDSETGLNRVRQELADIFRRMAVLRNSEVVLSNGGSGYRFNGEGNQVSYRCDAKRVTTINFDRNKIRGMAAELGRKADEVSAKLDQCIVNTVVDYSLPFEMNDSFNVILSDFIQRQSE